MLLGVDTWRASGGPLDGEPSLIDWSQARTAGVTFAGIRVSHGDSGSDEHGDVAVTSGLDVAWAREAGIVPMAFHMAYPDSASDAKVEAANLLDSCGWRPGDLPPALDIESNKGGLSDDDMALWALDFLTTVEKEVPVLPPWYTGKWFIDSDISSRYLLGLGRYPFWPSVWSGATDGSFWPSVWGRPADIWQRRYPEPGETGHLGVFPGGHGVDYIRDRVALDRLRGVGGGLRPGTYVGRWRL